MGAEGPLVSYVQHMDLEAVDKIPEEVLRLHPSILNQFVRREPYVPPDLDSMDPPEYTSEDENPQPLPANLGKRPKMSPWQDTPSTMQVQKKICLGQPDGPEPWLEPERIQGLPAAPVEASSSSSGLPGNIPLPPEANHESMPLVNVQSQQAPPPVEEDFGMFDDDTWVTMDMLMEKLHPIHDALETCHDAEDALFKHVREIRAWHDTEENRHQDALTACTNALRTSREEIDQLKDHAKYLEKWKAQFSMEVINMLAQAQGTEGPKNISENLKEVWKNFSDQLETLRLACQGHDGMLTKMEDDSKYRDLQLRELNSWFAHL